MAMKRITSDQVAEPIPETWSNCKVHGDFFQIAGCVSGYENNVIAGGDDVYEQAQITFSKIKNLVEAAGGVMDDIIKVTIFVTDISRREEVWKARREFFTGDFPCSTLVEVSALARPGLAVEIEAHGFIGSSK
jgi:enamine deaminase RidA (YjgF/YER057c/UK114 family)